MEVRRIDLEEYAAALPETGVEPFHDPDALSVLSEHVPGDPVILGGFKGQRAVGLFPAFVRSRAVGRVVTSPPPGMAVPRLGPVLNPASPKRRKREAVNREFVEAVTGEFCGARTVFRTVAGVDYPDPRPWEWADLSVTPSFTYRIDATRDPEALLSSFSKSLRREVRDARETPVTVERGGVEGARAIYDDTRKRYERQGEPFRLSWAYVRDLFAALGDRARAYTLRSPSGEYLGGITALYSPSAAYFWQGGTPATYEGDDVNGLAHWRVLRDVADASPVQGAREYDLVGANTARLCRYKAKFGGDLVPYYVAESGGAATAVAKRAYHLARR